MTLPPSSNLRAWFGGLIPSIQVIVERLKWVELEKSNRLLEQRLEGVLEQYSAVCQEFAAYCQAVSLPDPSPCQCPSQPLLCDTASPLRERKRKMGGLMYFCVGICHAISFLLIAIFGL